MNAGSDTKRATALDTGVAEAEETGATGQRENAFRQALFLHPGRVFAAADPYTVRIILGSCVAVCLWDPLRHVGGANHFLLPYGGLDAQFAEVAIRSLVKKLLALGCMKDRLTAKLFGGSCVIEAFRNRETHVGPKNVTVARQLLTYEGITVVAEDVGGQRGRKVIFQTDDGYAWVKQL